MSIDEIIDRYPEMECVTYTTRQVCFFFEVYSEVERIILLNDLLVSLSDLYTGQKVAENIYNFYDEKGWRCGVGYGERVMSISDDNEDAEINGLINSLKE